MPWANTHLLDCYTGLAASQETYNCNQKWYRVGKRENQGWRGIMYMNYADKLRTG